VSRYKKKAPKRQNFVETAKTRKSLEQKMVIQIEAIIYKVYFKINASITISDRATKRI
jgi:hypothetical protein